MDHRTATNLSTEARVVLEEALTVEQVRVTGTHNMYITSQNMPTVLNFTRP